MDWKDKIKKAVGIKPKETKELTSEEVRRKTLEEEKAQRALSRLRNLTPQTR